VATAAKQTLEGQVLDLGNFLGLGSPLLFRVLGRGMTWDRRTRDIIQAELTAIVALARKENLPARRELAGHLRQCAALLGPNEEAGLFGQLARSWMPSRLHPASAERLQATMDGFVQHAAEISQDLEGTPMKAGTPLGVLWPIDSPGQLWHADVQEYRGALKGLSSNVAKWAQEQSRGDHGDAAALLCVVREFERDPLPKPVAVHARSVFIKCYEWHRDFTRALLRQLTLLHSAEALGPGLGAMLREVRPPDVLAPFVVASDDISGAEGIGVRGLGSGMVVSGLVSMATAVPWGGLRAERAGKLGNLEKVCVSLWYAVRRAEDTQKLDEYAETARLLQHWVLEPASATLDKAVRERAGMVVELLGREDQDGTWRPRIRRAADSNLERAFSIIRAHLEARGVFFTKGKGTQAHFEDESPADVVVRQEGIARKADDGRADIWVPAKNHHSAGPRPTALLAHLGQRSIKIPNLDSAILWHLVRKGEQDAAEQTKPVRIAIAKAVVAMDKKALPDAALLKEWEGWLSHFVALFNEAAGRPVLKIDSAEEMRGIRPTHWQWSAQPHGADLRWQRRVELLGGQTARARFCSRGQREAPALLAEVAPTESSSEDCDLRSKEVRERIGLQILARGEPQSQRLTQALAAIGAKPYPVVGEPLDPQGPAPARVEYRFDERTPAGGVSEVRSHTLRFGKQILAGPPVDVAVSNGSAPRLAKDLLGLDEKTGSRNTSRIGAALGSYRFDDEKTRMPLVTVGLEMLNSLVKSGSEFTWVERLAAGIEEFGGMVVPSPRADGKYTWAAIEAQRIKREALFEARPALEEPSTRPEGEIARVQAFACIFGQALVRPAGGSGKVEWVKSLGPRSAELVMGELCVEEMAAAHAFLDAGAKTRHQGALEQLRQVSLQAYEGQAAAIATSLQQLVLLLADLDLASDVMEPATVDATRERVLAQLASRGARCEPAYARRGAPPSPGQRDLFFEVAAHDANVVEVLARRVTLPGGQPRGDIVCAVGRVGPVQPGAVEWQEIRELYVALREAYAGPAQRFAEFFDRCRRYLAKPEPTGLVAVVAAGEMAGRDHHEIRDLPKLRAAVEKIDRRIQDHLQYRRIDFRPGQPFRADKGEGYRTQRVKIEGKKAGLVVRILNAAYKDSSGRVVVRGLIQVTQ